MPSAFGGGEFFACFLDIAVIRIGNGKIQIAVRLCIGDKNDLCGSVLYFSRGGNGVVKDISRYGAQLVIRNNDIL